MKRLTKREARLLLCVGCRNIKRDIRKCAVLRDPGSSGTLFSPCELRVSLINEWEEKGYIK